MWIPVGSKYEPLSRRPLPGGQHGDREEGGQGGAVSAQVEPAGAILNLAKVMSVIRHGSPFSHFPPAS
jgi:hypothetical protein